MQNADEYETICDIAAGIDDLPPGLVKRHLLWSLGDGVKGGPHDDLLAEREARNGLRRTL